MTTPVNTVTQMLKYVSQLMLPSLAVSIDCMLALLLMIDIPVKSCSFTEHTCRSHLGDALLVNSSRPE